MNGKEKVKKLIKNARVGMFTTQDNDELVSRPIAVSQVDDNYDIWFFTDLNSDKVDEIINNQNINFSFSNQDENEYVSVSGKAELIKDQQKIDKLWSFFAKAWFPEGKNSERLTLIKVSPNTAQYWDGTSSKIIQLFKVAKAVATGSKYGEINETSKALVEF